MISILQGDCRETLRTLPDGSVHCCVTSPPYWGLRDYGHEGQIGLEESPEKYVETMVGVFREVRRVLREDGTLWLNLGDSYNNCDKWGGGSNTGKHTVADDGSVPSFAVRDKRPKIDGIKPKDLVGIPWMVAFALRADGWFLRSEIIWHKPNPMPESVTDRPTKAHETIFLLSKSPRYFYDAQAIREPASPELIKQVEEGYRGESTKMFAEGKAQDASGTKGRIIAGKRNQLEKMRGHERTHEGFRDKWDALSKAEQQALGANKRSVWTVATKPYRDAHFATYPPDLIKPCILAGCPVGGTVLDPFGGSGTTGEVALSLGRSAVLCELNPKYIPLIETRTGNTTPGLPLC